MPDGISESRDREKSVLQLGGRGSLVTMVGHTDRVTAERALVEVTEREPRTFPGKELFSGGKSLWGDGWCAGRNARGQCARTEWAKGVERRRGQRERAIDKTGLLH